MVNLENTVRFLYDKKVKNIKEKNKELERTFFEENAYMLPLPEMYYKKSFEDHYEELKDVIQNGENPNLDSVYSFLEDALLFTTGHDFIFMRKLEADLFMSEPIDSFIYPILKKAISKKYNDLSIMKENINYEKNMEDINKTINLYIELQSFLFFLYYNEFMFVDVRELYKDCYDEIINIIENSDIKIGDLLNGIVDYKCDKMKEVFLAVKDKNVKQKFINKINKLNKDKKDEIKTFAHSNLKIDYFKNHSIFELLSEEKASIQRLILEV